MRTGTIKRDIEQTKKDTETKLATFAGESKPSHLQSETQRNSYVPGRQNAKRFRLNYVVGHSANPILLVAQPLDLERSEDF